MWCFGVCVLGDVVNKIVLDVLLSKWGFRVERFWKFVLSIGILYCKIFGV